MLYLRVIFTILSAVCIAALIPLGALFGWAWVGYCFLGALLFFVFMLLCKQSQDIKALKSGKPEHSPAAMENPSAATDAPAAQDVQDNAQDVQKNEQDAQNEFTAQTNSTQPQGKGAVKSAKKPIKAQDATPKK